MRFSPLLVFVAACGGAGSTPAVEAGADTLTVLYSSRLDGEIEPCG